MTMLRHMDTTLRRLWKLGAAAFTCSFALILVACTLALPRLSADAEASLVGPLQSLVSPSLWALLLTPVAQPARKDARPVEIKPAMAAASGPATARSNVALTADEEEATQHSRLDAQLRALKEREASLNAKIKHALREPKQSRQELASPSSSATVASRPEPTPEELVLREKIERAKAKLAALLAYDTNQHPDVVSAQEELLTLESRLQELEIERWGKRETTTPVEAGTVTSAEVKVVEADPNVLEALGAARTAIEQQVVQVEQERRALRARIPEEKAATNVSKPVPGAVPLPVYVQATSAPAPPRLTWLGGLALGSPFAFLLSLLVAIETVRHMLDARRAGQ